MNRQLEINQGLYEWDLDAPTTEKSFSILDKIFLTIVALLVFSRYFFSLLISLGGFYRDLFSGTLRFSFSLAYHRFELVKDTGFILLLVGFIWIMFQIFKESLAYGVIVNWLPGLALMHVYLYFQRAKWPFLLCCLGVLLIVIG